MYPDACVLKILGSHATTFLAKCFKGGTEKEALNLMQKNFSKVHHVKPDASRKESVEGYVIALGFKGK